jgi:exodeoxyribonuclease V gamma subunit
VPQARRRPPRGPAPAATLLGSLQADLAGGRRTDDPPPLADDDRSVQVHSCHGRTRQVEVLREVVLGLLAADPTLEPRDVLVMCPDVETFAPLIAATFALGPRTPPPTRGPAARPARRPRAAADQPAAVGAVAARRAGHCPGHVVPGLDLAGTPAVRQRFGFDDDDLERLREWTTAAGIRWGFDAEHRSAWHLGGLDQGHLARGLDRLLLGAVTEGSSTT